MSAPTAKSKLQDFGARLKEYETTIRGNSDPSSLEEAVAQVQELDKMKQENLDDIAGDIEKFKKDHVNADKKVSNKVKKLEAYLGTIGDIWEKKHLLATYRVKEFRHIDEVHEYRQWLDDVAAPSAPPASSSAMEQELQDAIDGTARILLTGQRIRETQEQLLADRAKYGIKSRHGSPE